MGDHVVYLTGSSGFIGQVIVDQCQADESIARVYCPIREKKGVSGKARFEELLSGYSKASFVETTAPLPKDVTTVILNAYEVKFYNPLEQILRSNVQPILHILDQCRDAADRIRGISVISTAYVQPPLPFRRNERNRISFALNDHYASAFQLYQDLVSGDVTGDELVRKYGESLTEHHKINNYAFSKHILEHVVHEKYHELPICIVRPSIVVPSRDGQHGHGTRTGFPLFMEIARHPILRFPRNEGKLNLVFVEDVVEDIIDASCKVAQSATKSDDGAWYHPIVSSTSKSEMTAIEMLQLGAPDMKRFHIRSDTLRSILRRAELATICAIKGKRKAGLVEKMYENFDPIMSQNWDYEERHAPTASAVIECAKTYYRRQSSEDSSSSTESLPAKSQDPWMNDTVIALLIMSAAFLLMRSETMDVSPSLQMVGLFVLLRLTVISVMQTSFYGDTVIRKLFPSTIYVKGYDERQHEREVITWPSVVASGLEMYIVFQLGLLPDPTKMPLYTPRGLMIMLLTHALPVEFIYYWAHRFMHVYPSLYRVHKHHHKSVVSTPKTAVTFLWTEHFFYDLLFALPVLVPAALGEASIVTTLLYIPVFDIVNSLGHTNLELFPAWYMNSPMYFFFYCTTYHHVHHKYFKYNYALFMPIYDIVFGTYSKTRTEADFYAALKRRSG